MKVIDLLNKIANGEEVPKKIKYGGKDMFWCEPCKIYELAEVEQNELCGKDLYNILDNLNDEVEILEEPKGIPEKLKYTDTIYNPCDIVKKIFTDKINEILDYLKSKGE